jgi:hypothetical protein
MKDFSIGDKVWVSKAERRTKTVLCPICFGKLKVTLILGNEDHVELPCDYCGKGYDGPRGFLEQIEYFVGAEEAIIEGITLEETAEGKSYKFHFGNRFFDQKYVHTTKEEAERVCQEIADENNENESKRTEFIKYNTKKSFSWNAGYYMREVKRLEKSIRNNRR